MKTAFMAAAAASLLALAAPAQSQSTKVAIGISGWTGFAPLTLAKEVGLFEKNGLDVTLKKVPQKDRHLALASGDTEAAAIAARVTEEHVIAPMAEWLGPPDGRVRALEMAMLATGLVSYLRQLPLRETTRAEQERIVDWFAEAVQAIVDRQSK